MFDGPFDLFALIIAIIAFLIAIKASSQAAELRRRLSSLEEMVYAQRRVQPPPLMPTPVQAETPATTPARGAASTDRRESMRFTIYRYRIARVVVDVDLAPLRTTTGAADCAPNPAGKRQLI